MRLKQRDEKGSGDLFRARLDQIIDMKHELVRLAEETFVQIHRHPDRRHRANLRAQNRFLTDDSIAPARSGSEL